jgi:hypothetical protein
MFTFKIRYRDLEILIFKTKELIPFALLFRYGFL